MLEKKTIERLEQVSTPFYFYDMELLAATVANLVLMASKYDLNVHYAIKANVDRRVMRYIASNGIGADCVSGNEVLHALKCGFPASNIVFAGVGKSDKEIYDALNAGISMFNCESLHEIFVIDAMAEAYGLRANVSVRVNPNIDAHTHKYVTTGLSENKFGISSHEFGDLVEMLGRCSNIDFSGLHFHIGSQVTEVEDIFSLEARRANEIVAFFEEKGLEVRNVDFGGGLGIDYEEPDDNRMPPFGLWFKSLTSNFTKRPGQQLHVEPGRALVAQCGTLVSRVLFVKGGETKTFLILDAGMNDLLRPALYGSYHKIENLSARLRPSLTEEQIYDVVGPVCESSDVWGQGRILPFSVRGDLMAIRSAGAYGQVMANKYNLRDLAPAVYSDDLESAPIMKDYFSQYRF